ncbi:MAG: hypothetical protein AMJ61_09370 [Desulfobacterales bacterium SG8_35_2]|nr:MAG: hypothetical protein AMJ61_09370 [Desulfobacterales bacterium SG8_35_2]
MAAPYFQGRLKDREAQNICLIVLASVLLLPALFPEKIGWLTSLVPLPVFYCLVSLGKNRGTISVRNAILFAAGGALLFGSLPMLIFSLTLVPVGIAFAYGVYNRKSPVATGFMAFLLLALTWLLYWSGLALLLQTNPYATLLAELDNGLSSGLILYEESAELAPETLASLRKAVELLRVYIPKILPAIFVSAILSTVWLNLALGNWLLKKKQRELTPWPEYNEWKLPDAFVWLVVLSGIIFLLLPQPLSILGLNGLIVCSTVYFFQGLAIAASLLNRWSVPRLLRVPIYALIFIQTYGIIVLSFLGMVDVWADFRKLNRTADKRNSSA